MIAQNIADYNKLMDRKMVISNVIFFYVVLAFVFYLILDITDQGWRVGYVLCALVGLGLLYYLRHRYANTSMFVDETRGQSNKQFLEGIDEYTLPTPFREAPMPLRSLVTSVP